jgi:hypothetical protein
MLALFAALAMMTGDASATDINGWTSHTGPDYELYMAESSDVGAYELVMLVNYDIHTISLELWETNGSMIYTESVAPQSSKVMQLDYGTVDCEIRIVSSYYGLEGSFQRTHVYELLPPPSSSGGWTISPPEARDPDLIYTDADLAEAIGNAFFSNIIQTAVALTAGVLVGAGVKHTVKFWKPFDFISMAVYGVVIGDVLLSFSPWGWIWSVVFVVGYVIGFVVRPIDSATPMLTDPQAKVINLVPMAVYWPKDTTGCCIQDQNNRALAKRLLLGVHHRLETDVGITSDWTVIAQRPGRTRKMKFRMFVAEKEEIVETIRKGWILKYKELTTRFKVGYASKVSLVEFLVDFNAYYSIQDQHEEKSAKLADLELRRRSDAADTAAKFHEKAMQVSPMQAPKKLLARWGEQATKIKTPWRTMTRLDETSTPTPVQVTPEKEVKVQKENEKDPAPAEEKEDEE